MELWEHEAGNTTWESWTRSPRLIIEFPEDGIPSLEIEWVRKTVFGDGRVVLDDLPSTLLAMNELSGEDLSDALVLGKALSALAKRRVKKG